jgi:RNA polymerase sigma factor (sigma-70 family)
LKEGEVASLEPDRVALAQQLTLCAKGTENERQAAWDELARMLLPWLQNVTTYEIISRYDESYLRFTDDFVAEAFIRLYTHGTSLPDKFGVKGWLRIVIRNKIFDTFKRTRYYSHEEMVDGFNTLDFKDPSETSEYDPLLVRALHRAIRSLPPDQRQLLFRVYWQNQTPMSIAGGNRATSKMINARLIAVRAKLAIKLMPCIKDLR